MATIEESAAWELLKQYAQECAEINRDTLLAIYGIGSLAGGFYRPGHSDIDAVLIVADGSETTWGDSDTPGERLRGLNETYKRRYEIPKDFGPFPVQAHQLLPPYDPAKELTLEIARLKLQGKIVYGSFPLSDIPMPGRADFLRDFHHFEEFWDNDFAWKTSPGRLTETECCNSILMYLNRYLILEKRIIQFDKRNTIPLCTLYEAPFMEKDALETVKKHLRLEDISETELRNLRQYVVDLRHNMNVFLKI